MTDWIDHVVRAIGVRGREAQGTPFPVVIVPEDYAPPLRREGLLSAVLAAGGAGLRSEVALVAVGADRTGGVIEIEDVWVAGAGATDVEIVSVPVISGFTDLPFRSTDLRAGRGPVALQVKNTAAATANGVVLMGSEFRTPAANIYLGPLPLRAILENGGNGTNAILFRPIVDNVPILLIASWRHLGIRKL